MVKKLIILVFIPIYLLGSCGMFMYLHHCNCSKITTTSFFTKDKQEDCCKIEEEIPTENNDVCCETEIKTSDSFCNITESQIKCCDTKSVYFKIMDEQSNNNSTFSFALQFVATFFSPLIQSNFSEKQNTSLPYFDDVVLFDKTKDFLNFIHQLKIAC